MYVPTSQIQSYPRLFIIAVCNKTIVAFSFVVIFKRGRSLVIVLSPSNVCWPFKKSDYPLVAPRVFCDVNGGNRIQTVMSQATWPLSQWISDDGHIPAQRTTNCMFFK